MSFAERASCIKQIQDKRKSKVITYFLSDRDAIPRGNFPGMKANIAQDAKIIFYNILETIGKQERLDLFIYTRGGDTNAVWPIVSLFREYCQEFSVLIPFRCHSSGTMICLGADKVIMSKTGELSPIDPTTGNPYNPIDETNNRSRKGISVEDVTSYLLLAQDEKKFNLKNAQILEVFKELTRTVHPLALGNVNRVHTQIRLLAKKLLTLHLNADKDKDCITRITDMLTEQFYSHLHFINRKEALEILGNNIAVETDIDLEKMMMDLYESYAESLKIRHAFCCKLEMGTDTSKDFELYSGLIEGENISYALESKISLFQRSSLPPNIQLTLQPGQMVPPIIPGFPTEFIWEIISENWVKNEGGNKI